MYEKYSTRYQKDANWNKMLFSYNQTENLSIKDLILKNKGQLQADYLIPYMVVLS